LFDIVFILSSYWKAGASAIHGGVRVAQVVDLGAGFILMEMRILPRIGNELCSQRTLLQRGIHGW
jgi:hypothetical protein